MKGKVLLIFLQIYLEKKKGLKNYHQLYNNHISEADSSIGAGEGNGFGFFSEGIFMQ